MVHLRLRRRGVWWRSPGTRARRELLRTPGVIGVDTCTRRAALRGLEKYLTPDGCTFG